MPTFKGFGGFSRLRVLALVLSLGAGLAVFILRGNSSRRALISKESGGQPHFSLVSYNVENLFDTIHDAGHDDRLYLPLDLDLKKRFCRSKPKGRSQKKCLAINWTTERLDIKIGQIKKVVEAIGGGEIPDFLAVVEIENDAVAKELAKALGYEHVVITNGPDRRGIDQALFFKADSPFRFQKMVQRAVKSPSGAPLRVILEAHFTFGSDQLIIFVNHWPSQAAPLSFRLQTAKELKALVEAAQREDPHVRIVATGDFNVTPSESSAVEKVLQPMLDVHALAAQDNEDQPAGTYFYPRLRQWSRFDRFFVNQTFLQLAGLHILPSSYQIFAATWMEESFSMGRSLSVLNIPRRYDFTSHRSWRAGFSDHFPIRLDFSDLSH